MVTEVELSCLNVSVVVSHLFLFPLWQGTWCHDVDLGCLSSGVFSWQLITKLPHSHLEVIVSSVSVAVGYLLLIPLWQWTWCHDVDLGCLSLGVLSWQVTSFHTPIQKLLGEVTWHMYSDGV